MSGSQCQVYMYNSSSVVAKVETYSTTPCTTCASSYPSVLLSVTGVCAQASRLPQPTPQSLSAITTQAHTSRETMRMHATARSSSRLFELTANRSDSRFVYNAGHARCLRELGHADAADIAGTTLTLRAVLSSLWTRVACGLAAPRAMQVTCIGVEGKEIGRRQM